jgi:hypothetical protein
MRFWLGFASLACLTASAGLAQGATGIGRSVWVERQARGARMLEPATTLRPGDKVVLVVEWQASAPGRRFTVASEVPRALAFQRAASEAAEVSIDGGRTWGDLGTLHIGSRLASAEDVTHVRQRVSGATAGRMTFSAIVR